MKASGILLLVTDCYGNIYDADPNWIWRSGVMAGPVKLNKIVDGNATATGMNRLLDGENVKDTVK